MDIGIVRPRVGGTARWQAAHERLAARNPGSGELAEDPGADLLAPTLDQHIVRLPRPSGIVSSVFSIDQVLIAGYCW